MSETLQTTLTGPTSLSTGGSFEGGVTEVLRGVRTAFAAVIAALPGGIAKAADLQRALKIDMKLSWKVFKVLNATDPLLAGPHVPGPANVATFLKAAAKRGVALALIDAAEQAHKAFQEFVQTHASERAAFDSMVTSLGSSDIAGPMLLQHMRAAFRANRHVWGVQAKTHLRCVLVQPAPQPDMVSFAVVQGYVRLRRLRTQAPLVVSRARVTDNDGTLRQVVREPIDPAGETEHGIALIREFCSQPLPQFRTVQGSAGFVYGEMICDGVGNRAAVTCIDGHMTPLAGPRYRDERNEFLRSSVRVRIPCEALVFDLLVRAGTWGAIAPTVGVYAEDLSGGPVAGGPQERDRLDIQESITYLGRGPTVLHTPDVPRYTDLARYVFTRLGWEGNAFDVYRCRIEYPVMASTVRIAAELPHRPPG
jgi:hypothetical protein